MSWHCLCFGQGYMADLAEDRTGTSLKTLLNGLAIELWPLEHTVERRGWEVRSCPGQLLLRVWATGRSLKETPRGATPYGRDWTEKQIERGVVHAVENALVSSSAGTASVVREVTLTSYDMYAANGLL